MYSYVYLLVQLWYQAYFMLLGSWPLLGCCAGRHRGRLKRVVGANASKHNPVIRPSVDTTLPMIVSGGIVEPRVVMMFIMPQKLSPMLALRSMF